MKHFFILLLAAAIVGAFLIVPGMAPAGDKSDADKLRASVAKISGEK